jgi:hypothetical protein
VTRDETLRSFTERIEHFRRLFAVAPEVVEELAPRLWVVLPGGGGGG